jgi:hypothetical protein
MRLPVSAIYGQSVPYVNAAKMRNSGFEFVLGYHGEANKFKYDIAGNASFIKNSVRDLKKTDPIINDYTFWEVPYPMNSYYGYQTEGLFQTQAEIDKAPIQPGGASTRPGDIKYKDQNNDGKIDGNDRVYLGTYFPKVTYGLKLSMEWKGFDLELFFQGAGGVKGFVRNEMFGSLGEQIGKPTSIWLNHWTPDNPNADFPRPFAKNIQNSPTQYPSDFWIRTADYLRLKQLSFGYTLKSEFLGKAGIQSLRVYYSGANLFTFSKFYSWVDPEAVSQGVDGGRLYPMVKTSTIGLNLSF